MTGTIRVNGKDRPLEAATLAELLERSGIASTTRGIAAALNGEVVPRALWPSTNLAAGDAIEIVKAFQGG